MDLLTSGVQTGVRNAPLGSGHVELGCRGFTYEAAWGNSEERTGLEINVCCSW